MHKHKHGITQEIEEKRKKFPVYSAVVCNSGAGFNFSLISSIISKLREQREDFQDQSTHSKFLEAWVASTTFHLSAWTCSAQTTN